MKDLLYLCTNNNRFSFDNNIYIQNGGITMGSPLGPILANIFMVKLEHSVVPGLANKLNNCRRYVDDTICYIKVDSTDFVISKLNNFYKNIWFTVEVEKEVRMSFLNVLMIRDKYNIETTAHRKSTNNSIYLNWTSHAPNKWKMGTLQTLEERMISVRQMNNYKMNYVTLKRFFMNKILGNKVFCEIKRSNYQQH